MRGQSMSWQPDLGAKKELNNTAKISANTTANTTKWSAKSPTNTTMFEYRCTQRVSPLCHVFTHSTLSNESIGSRSASSSQTLSAP